MMLVTGYGRVAQTVNALIKVCAGGTVITLPLEYLTRADGTLLDKFWSISIVKVPEDHHRGMFCTAEGVKLIVVALTEVEEQLAVIEEFTVHFFLVIINDLDETALAVLGKALGRFLGKVGRLVLIWLCRADLHVLLSLSHGCKLASPNC